MTTLDTVAPLQSIAEQHTSTLQFNVMPGRPVEERLLVREYRVGHRYAEAHFDREYRSSMRNSPSHLIFLSALTHTQKLLYLALCREFGLPYDPQGPELFKMWPTKVEVRIPELIAVERDLVQELWVREVKQFSPTRYRVVVETRVGSLSIRATIPTFLLEAGS
ncbi:MAG: hypothetical protein AB7O97_16535 [Planctomycetota bacterium]